MPQFAAGADGKGDGADEVAGVGDRRVGEDAAEEMVDMTDGTAVVLILVDDTADGDVTVAVDDPADNAEIDD